MFKQLAIASFISLSFILPSHAETLIPIATASQGVSQYLDVDTVQGKNGYYQYQSVSSDGKVVTKTQMSTACRERMANIVAEDRYTPNGNLIASSNYGNKRKLQPIVAGSTLALFSQAICSH
jgi:hypothetical protein